MSEPTFTLSAPTALESAKERLAALLDRRADLDREIEQAQAVVTAEQDIERSRE